MVDVSALGCTCSAAISNKLTVKRSQCPVHGTAGSSVYLRVLLSEREETFDLPEETDSSG